TVLTSTSFLPTSFSFARIFDSQSFSSRILVASPAECVASSRSDFIRSSDSLSSSSFSFLRSEVRVESNVFSSSCSRDSRSSTDLIFVSDARTFDVSSIEARLTSFSRSALVDRGRLRDDVKEGSLDLRREGADQVDDDDQRPAALRFDCEVGREQGEEDHQDGHDQRGPEAPELPRAESLPRDPHRDDRQG